MKTFLNMGEAVHAILPYLSRGADPLACTLGALENHLRTVYPFNRYDHELELAFLERTLECWRVVGHYLKPATTVYCEPDFLGTKRVDLVVEFANYMDVVELKTSAASKRRGIRKQKLIRRGHAQVNDALSAARAHWPHRAVHGYLLHFNNSRLDALKPQWQRTAPFRFASVSNLPAPS